MANPIRIGACEHGTLLFAGKRQGTMEYGTIYAGGFFSASRVWAKVSGSWVEARAWIKDGGAWILSAIRMRTSGVWTQ